MARLPSCLLLVAALAWGIAPSSSFPCGKIPHSFLGDWKSSLDPHTRVNLQSNSFSVLGKNAYRSWVLNSTQIATSDIRCSSKNSSVSVSSLLPSPEGTLWHHCMYISQNKYPKQLDVNVVLSHKGINVQDCLNTTHLNQPNKVTREDNHIFQFVLFQGDPPDIGKVEALGCIVPRLQKGLPEVFVQWMTPGRCAMYCLLKLFPFFGLSGNTCQCRPTHGAQEMGELALAKRADFKLFNQTLHDRAVANDDASIPNKCVIKCSGNASASCGGAGVVSMYQIRSPNLLPDTSDYLGCFNKESNMKIYLVGTGITVESCQAYCGSQGFLYTHLSKQKFCWCSQDYLRSGQNHGSSRCDQPCLGNSSQTCGGARVSSVFRNSRWLSRTLCNEIPSQFAGTWYLTNSDKSVTFYSSSYKVYGSATGPSSNMVDPFWEVDNLILPYKLYCFGNDIVRLHSAISCHESHVIHQCLTMKASPDNMAVNVVGVIQLADQGQDPNLDCDRKFYYNHSTASHFYYELALSRLRIWGKINPILGQTEQMVQTSPSHFSFEFRDLPHYPVEVIYLTCVMDSLLLQEVFEDSFHNETMLWLSCAYYCVSKSYTTFSIHSGHFCNCGFYPKINHKTIGMSRSLFQSCGKQDPSCRQFCNFHVALSSEKDKILVSMYRIVRKGRLYGIPDENFLGCFPGAFSTLNRQSVITKTMSVEFCVHHCHLFGYRYAALKGGKPTQCACASELVDNRGNKLSEMPCGKSCSGAWGVCGSRNAATVYEVPPRNLPEVQILKDPPNSTPIKDRTLVKECSLVYDLNNKSTTGLQNKFQRESHTKVNRHKRTSGRKVVPAASGDSDTDEDGEDEDIYMMRGSTHVVSCVPPADESQIMDPHIKWSKGGHPLTDGRFDELPTGELKVTDVEPKDTGDYDCEVNGQSTGGESVSLQFKKNIFVFVMPTEYYHVKFTYSASSCTKEIVKIKKEEIHSILCSSKVCVAKKVKGKCQRLSHPTLNGGSQALLIMLNVSLPKSFILSKCDTKCMRNSVVHELQKQFKFVQNYIAQEDATNSDTNDLKIMEGSLHKKLIQECPGGYRLFDKVCLPCKPGAYSTRRQIRCRLCPAGTYQPEYASEVCLPCNQGIKEEGSTVCGPVGVVVALPSNMPKEVLYIIPVLVVVVLVAIAVLFHYQQNRKGKEPKLAPAVTEDGQPLLQDEMDNMDSNLDYTENNLYNELDNFDDPIYAEPFGKASTHDSVRVAPIPKPRSHTLPIASTNQAGSVSNHSQRRTTVSGPLPSPPKRPLPSIPVPVISELDESGYEDPAILYNKPTSQESDLYDNADAIHTSPYVNASKRNSEPIYHSLSQPTYLELTGCDNEEFYMDMSGCKDKQDDTTRMSSDNKVPSIDSGHYMDMSNLTDQPVYSVPSFLPPPPPVGPNVSRGSENNSSVHQESGVSFGSNISGGSQHNSGVHQKNNVSVASNISRGSQNNSSIHQESKVSLKTSENSPSSHLLKDAESWYSCEGGEN